MQAYEPKELPETVVVLREVSRKVFLETREFHWLWPPNGWRVSGEPGRAQRATRVRCTRGLGSRAIGLFALSLVREPQAIAALFVDEAVPAAFSVCSRALEMRCAKHGAAHTCCFDVSPKELK